MSVSYIPEETYVVCTYQMSATPQKLIASRNKDKNKDKVKDKDKVENKNKVTVFHNRKPLLTEEDKNLKEQLPCKFPINLSASFFAFGAGIMIKLKSRKITKLKIFFILIHSFRFL